VKRLVRQKSDNVGRRPPWRTLRYACSTGISAALPRVGKAAKKMLKGRSTFLPEGSTVRPPGNGCREGCKHKFFAATDCIFKVSVRRARRPGGYRSRECKCSQFHVALRPTRKKKKKKNGAENSLISLSPQKEAGSDGVVALKVCRLSRFDTPYFFCILVSGVRNCLQIANWLARQFFRFVRLGVNRVATGNNSFSLKAR